MKAAHALAAVALAFSAHAAFAFGPTQDRTLRGGGEWKMADGTVSTWSSVMTVQHGNDSVTVTDALTIVAPDGTTHSENCTWHTEPKGNGFYDVIVDGEKRGTSYCFGMDCHVDIQVGDERSEETFRFDGGKVIRTGSGTEHGMTYAWTGTMNPAD